MHTLCGRAGRMLIRWIRVSNVTSAPFSPDLGLISCLNVMTRPSLNQNLLHGDRSRTWFGSCYALRLPQHPDPTQVCMKHWMRVRPLLIGSLMYTHCSVCSLNAGPPWDAAGFPPSGPALF